MWLGPDEAPFPPWTENKAQVAVTCGIFSQGGELDSLGLLTSAKILIPSSQPHFEANLGTETNQYH